MATRSIKASNASKPTVPRPAREEASSDSLVLEPETDGKPRRVQGGIATSDVVLSAAMSGNAEIFPSILALHVPKGAVIADVTWGKGVFWQKVPPDDYTLLASDGRNRAAVRGQLAGLRGA
jgi:hypothetical protein